MGLRAGLDPEARGEIVLPLLGVEPRSPGRPARSQTLYRLSYLGSQFHYRYASMLAEPHVGEQLIFFLETRMGNRVCRCRRLE
jgi:hypothetical protein